jgi:purine-binding chemotaxis protein CheW
MRSPTEAIDSEVQELVVFRTAAQDFCVDILMVREIRGWTRPARISTERLPT